MPSKTLRAHGTKHEEPSDKDETRWAKRRAMIARFAAEREANKQ